MKILLTESLAESLTNVNQILVLQKGTSHFFISDSYKSLLPEID
jgi:hypothetical protein